MKVTLCNNTPTGRPLDLNLQNNSWPSDRLVVSLITGQKYFTFLYGHTRHNIHNREGEGKENKQTRTLVISKRKKGEVYDTFLAFCASVSYREREFEQNSHKVTRNVGSSLHVCQPGLWAHWSKQSAFPRLLLTALTCRLSSLFWSLFSAVHFGTSDVTGDLARKPFVWVSHQNRQRNHLTGTHPHPYPHNECPTSWHSWKVNIYF